MHIEKSINDTKSRLLKKNKSQSFDFNPNENQDESEVHLDEILQSKWKHRDVEIIEEEEHD